MNPKEMTGLQLLQAMCAGKIPPASISETIPMQPYEVSEGTIHFKVKADHRHLNPLGGVHGGFAATVLDSVTRLCGTQYAGSRCRLWHHRLEYKNVPSHSQRTLCCGHHH